MVENTISNSPEVLRASFLESGGLFCFIDICKFGSFKNTFAMITVFVKLTLDSEDLFCCYKQKRSFL